MLNKSSIRLLIFGAFLKLPWANRFDIKYHGNDITCGSQMWSRNCKPFRSTWITSIISGVNSCWSLFNCRCSALYVIACHFFFSFLFAIVLSLLLRCMPSDYLFGTIKLSSLLNECFISNQFIPFIDVIVIHNAIVFLLRTNYEVGWRSLVSSISSM